MQERSRPCRTSHPTLGYQIEEATLLLNLERKIVKNDTYHINRGSLTLAKLWSVKIIKLFLTLISLTRFTTQFNYN